MRTLRMLGAGLLVAATVWAVWWLFPSDDRKIRALLVQLCDVASVDAGEDAIARMARAARLGPLLTEVATVELQEGTPILRGRDAIVGTVANMAALAGALEVEALEPAIEIAPDRTSADVTTTVRLSEAGPDGALTQREEWTAELRVRKVDGEWLLDRVRGAAVKR